LHQQKLKLRILTPKAKAWLGDFFFAVQEEERDEMRDVLDMKRVHRKYVQRRLAKQQRAANAAADANAKTNEPGTRDPLSGAAGK
jgi:hypothetical protein